MRAPLRSSPRSWDRQIVNAAQKLKRTRSQGPLYYMVLCACLLLTIVQMPMQMASAFMSGSDLGKLLDTVANGVFGLYMLAMLIAAIYYVTLLTGVLTSMNDVRMIAIVNKVRNVVFACIAVVLMTLTGIVMYAMLVDLCKDNGPTATMIYMVFIMLIHGGEVIGIAALLYQLQQAKKDKGNKGALASSNAGGTGKMSSVAPTET